MRTMTWSFVRKQRKEKWFNLECKFLTHTLTIGSLKRGAFIHVLKFIFRSSNAARIMDFKLSKTANGKKNCFKLTSHRRFK